MSEMRKNELSRGFSAVVAILIAVIVLGGIGAFVMSRRPSTSTPSSAVDRSTPAGTESAVPTGETTSTLTDVIGQGKNLECDWKMPTNGEANPFGTGKLYTTGNKGRSMISGSSSGMSIDGNAIYKDGEVYSWISVAGTTMGFKFDKTELESMSAEMTAEQKQQAEQIRAKMIFQCKPWTPDESKFILPTGVEFK